MEEYLKKWLGFCGVVKPGQDEEFGKMYGVPGVLNKDTKKDIVGKTKGDFESDLNYRLRKANFGCLKTSQIGGSTDKGTYPGCNPNNKDTSNYNMMEKQALKDKYNKITWVSGGKDVSLSREQAEAALKSSTHAYSVPDKTMKPYLYTKGSTVTDAEGKRVLVRRQDCKFLTPPTSPNSNTNPNSNNPNGNNPNGNQNGFNPSQFFPPFSSSTPTPTPTANPSATCPKTYSPVCGKNGQTQLNSCVANLNNVTIAYNGACNTTSNNTIKSEDITNIGKLISEAVSGGIPSNALSSTVHAILSLLEGLYNGAKTTVLP